MLATAWVTPGHSACAEAGFGAAKPWVTSLKSPTFLFYNKFNLHLAGSFLKSNALAAAVESTESTESSQSRGTAVFTPPGG